MYIEQVEINNFRNLKNLKVNLNQYNILIGENNAGKTNFLEAINLVLNNEGVENRNRRLTLNDINSKALEDFEQILRKCYQVNKDLTPENIDEIRKVIPNVVIRLTFVYSESDDKYYEMGLLKDWINDVEDEVKYQVEYEFAPENIQDFINACISALKGGGMEFRFPIEEYTYKIFSTNNKKRINYEKNKNFNMNYIKAERDNFSSDTYKSSYKIISKLLDSNISNTDKNEINNSYKKFFNELKNLESFKDTFNYIDKDKFFNIEEIINELNLIPNNPNLNTIFSNITIGYGDSYLNQHGLGKRNLILLILLFSLYKKDNRKVFNLVALEEPEAHLCINNFNIMIDFIEKSLDDLNPLTQMIITSHNTRIINKLKLDRLIIFKDGKAISLKESLDKRLVSYLSKTPNFDILSFLFCKKVILVEGKTEEMYINTLLNNDINNLSNITVIAIGQKGFTTFLDAWLVVNAGTDNKIGVIRDFDNQLTAKDNHDKYDNDNDNIFVRTTTRYSLEDEIVFTGKNFKSLKKYYGLNDKNEQEVIDHMKNNKADTALDLCISIDEGKLELETPKHIKEVLECLQQ